MTEPVICQRLREAWHLLDDRENLIGRAKELIEEALAEQGCDPITPPDPPEVPPPAA